MNRYEAIKAVSGFMLTRRSHISRLPDSTSQEDRCWHEAAIVVDYLAALNAITLKESVGETPMQKPTMSRDEALEMITRIIYEGHRNTEHTFNAGTESWCKHEAKIMLDMLVETGAITLAEPAKPVNPVPKIAVSEAIAAVNITTDPFPIESIWVDGHRYERRTLGECYAKRIIMALERADYTIVRT